jgi:hypothetical protein
MQKRTFKLLMSEKCFRFKPDALPSHAPQKPGVYEFVTFDSGGNPTVLYVGIALNRSVSLALGEHMMGQARPTAVELFGVSKDIYFDYVAEANIESLEDFKDIAGVLIAKHKPRFNSEIPTSGKYASVEIQETDQSS